LFSILSETPDFLGSGICDSPPFILHQKIILLGFKYQQFHQVEIFSSDWLENRTDVTQEM